MTLIEATEKALKTFARTGHPQLVILRTDHPHVAGDYFYTIAKSGKHAWTPGERLIMAVEA